MVGSEVFVDSNFWIAAARERDAQHERAKALGTEMLGRRAVAVISDMVFGGGGYLHLEKGRARSGWKADGSIGSQHDNSLRRQIAPE